MDNKRIVTVIMIAAAAVLILVYALWNSSSPKNPGNSGRNEETFSEDSSVIDLPEEMEEEAAENSETVKDGDSKKEQTETETPAAEDVKDSDEKKQEEHSTEENDGSRKDQNEKETDNSAASTEYDAFLAKSPAEQDAFMKSFGNEEAFTEWLLKAQKEWAEAHPASEIGPDGTIDLGE